MATLAQIAGFTIQLGNEASPQVYTTIEEVLNVGALGTTSDDLDVTNFDSTDGQKEFIAGLAEGNEITIECNDVGGTIQTALIAAQGNNRHFKANWTKVSPNRTVTFIASVKGYEYAPSNTEQNKINFTLKVSSWNI
jgi:hypothetical protein